MLLLLTLPALSQTGENPPSRASPADTTSPQHLHLFSGKDQVDLIDIGRSLLLKHPTLRTDTTGNKNPGKLYPALLPAAEYTLETGFAVDLVGSLAFYTGSGKNQNISSIYLASTFTQKSQIILPLQANIWTKGNKYNIATDWRFEIFPQDTYGLGTLTTIADADSIDFDYLRFYTTLLKTVAKDFYLGFGYDIDYFYKVRDLSHGGPGNPTVFETYSVPVRSVSTGPTFNILYDGRRNEINPETGYYANIIFRPNFTFLGSDANWQSLQIDARRYIHFPARSRNTLAFWTYDVFNFNNHTPYLLLPSTQSDTYANMGRGYIGGRFRGKDLVYLETEYRYGITSNGFLGGVVFVNAQSCTEPVTNRFEAIAPGLGAGIRIKLNKFPRTNIALDYGFGLHGSQGIFANLGEVF
jgi:Omp85 superfamily domain